MEKIIIIGATSGIGYEVAKRYIKMGWKVGIAGRRMEPLRELQSIAPDRVNIKQIDINDPNAPLLLEELIDKVGGMDVYLHSSGIGKQNKELIPEIEIDTVMTNAEGWTRMVTTAFNYFKKKKTGHLAVISSIAGTKGLGMAPSYSATKSFQNTYMEALAQLVHLEKSPVILTDIRPGFVKTPLLKDDIYPLMMDSGKVADKIIRAIHNKKRVTIIDWRYSIMVFFWRLIPRAIWERLPIKM